MLDTNNELGIIYKIDKGVNIKYEIVYIMVK